MASSFARADLVELLLGLRPLTTREGPEVVARADLVARHVVVVHQLRVHVLDELLGEAGGLGELRQLLEVEGLLLRVVDLEQHLLLVGGGRAAHLFLYACVAAARGRLGGNDGGGGRLRGRRGSARCDARSLASMASCNSGNARAAVIARVNRGERSGVQRAPRSRRASSAGPAFDAAAHNCVL